MSLLQTGLTAAIQTAVNQFLELDQHAKSQLQSLAGKVLAIEFSDLPLKLYFIPTDDDLQIFSQYDGVADTRLRGTSVQILAMGGSARPGESLFKGEVSIEGDIDLGQRFQEILRNMDIDWEERLSYLVGDVAAHKLGNAARSLINWGRQTALSVEDNLGEYLQFESNTVPARFEIDQFQHEVDTLRNDVERLEARIQRITSTAPKAKAGK
jgi:ubiquinone biosynthesis protein UbiJ